MNEALPFSSQFFESLNYIEKVIADVSVDDISSFASDLRRTREQKIESVINTEITKLDSAFQARARAEFKGFGPLETLMTDPSISEILVNNWDNVWFEQQGRLQRHPDRFASAKSYQHCLERLSDESRLHLSLERPMAQGKLRDFRVQWVGAEIAPSGSILSLRRHPKNPWNFELLERSGWASSAAFTVLQRWLKEQVNFLVVGPTGSGKTSIVNACLQNLPVNERVLLLEDTEELVLPNPASQRLLTRIDPQGILPEINIGDLVKQSLRLRPDRLVVGEIRGSEAKDFLMALSTGHAGSFGTIHASSPQQALIRLEMLVQLGAPHWGLSAIRRLIYLSLQGIIVVGRNETGARCLRGIYRISSLEESGLLVEKEYDAGQSLWA